MTYREQVEARLREDVRRGELVLDEREDGWDLRIDRSNFEIVHCERCVLGQLYGAYGVGVHHLNLSERNFGFHVPDDLPNEDWVWDKLQEIWEETLDRRAAKVEERELVPA